MTDGITSTDINVLKLVKDNNEEMRASEIGFYLYPDGKPNRSAQGMALAGGKAMSNVIKKGLVTRKIYIDNYRYKLTNLGYEALRKLKK